MKKVFALSALLVLATMPSVYACETSARATPEDATTPAAATCESGTHATPKAKTPAAVVCEGTNCVTEEEAKARAAVACATSDCKREPRACACTGGVLWGLTQAWGSREPPPVQLACLSRP
jgi:hypothetical protein